ncbi:MAG TPA: imidazole glycerol phosphate synthase subunit HisF [Terriglobales bacterium]|jgi:cyclase|nr:imidazole glycerol phosphate synthase subunit HisF [Terriglobales bacterium]
MLTKRIIACLDVNAGRVVKGVCFADLRDAGDPAELARRHAEAGADEIVLLDISATREQRATLLDVVQRTARELFLPFTVGGGIRSLYDAAAVIEAGADKVAINSAALATPKLISQIADQFGSQAVVVAVDAKRDPQHDNWQVWVAGGTKPTGVDVLAWVQKAESYGAGEILLTSMDRDGTQAGFECELTSAVFAAVSIPVIASGGAGSANDFLDVFRRGRADAALAASIFHDGVSSIRELKSHLAAQGIPVRLPC